jgi:hypothetical protein
MTAEQVARFEAAAGGLLDELGYLRAVPRDKNTHAEEASRIRSVLMKSRDWAELRNLC